MAYLVCCYFWQSNQTEDLSPLLLLLLCMLRQMGRFLAYEERIP